jgi:hypothetical protein
MASKSQADKDRANAAFRKKEEVVQEKEKVWAEREADATAVRQKSARLKELRLTKEAADKEAAPSKKKPVARTKKKL